MNIDSDYARSMAEQLASYDVQPGLARVRRNEANYRAQLDAVTKLESALRTFRSAVTGLKSGGKTMLVNSASFSQEGYATANVKANAVPGNYQFFVEQLASQHQIALQGLQDGDIEATGSLQIDLGGESFSIDLSAADSSGDGVVSLAELSAAINGASDNAGVQATLVRSNGEVSLVLTSENSGASNAIGLSLSGAGPGSANFADAVASPLELSAARDARVRLGGETGLLLTSSSNTFDELIDGVSLTFNRTHSAGDTPLTVEVGQDSEATQAQVKTFIDAYNSLVASLKSLTASGGENSTRGPLAGDSSVRAIQEMLNRTLRNEFDGMRLMDFGISADRNGRLSLDSSRFDAAVAANPEGLNKLFSGKDNLIDSLDKSLHLYTNVTTGVLKNRKESINLMLRRTDQQMSTLEQQYDRYYNRYLRQYTNMMQMMAAMQQTQGMF